MAATRPSGAPADVPVAPIGPAPQPKPEETPPAVREHIHENEATSVLGRAVKDAKGDNIGRIVNVLVDDKGAPRAGVIEFGGFMGVGSRQIAVVWRALKFDPRQADGPVTLDMTIDQLKAIPEYSPSSGKPIVVAAPPPVAPPVAAPPAAAAPPAVPPAAASHAAAPPQATPAQIGAKPPAVADLPTKPPPAAPAPAPSAPAAAPSPAAGGH
jgi:PRC-barrel domain